MGTNQPFAIYLAFACSDALRALTSCRRWRKTARRESVMRRVAEMRIVLALLAIVLVPAAAVAQSSITGVVRDTSGAVLPGVTVEAASDVLIEKVRSAVTDGTGQYRILELRPGLYTVTF